MRDSSQPAPSVPFRLSTASLRAEIAHTFRLGGPLALGELGWMSTYIVDAVMIGHLAHSTLAISASSLGNTIYYAIVFVAIGMLTGVETLTAQAFGREDRPECLRVLAQSMAFVLLGTPLVMLATLASIPLLPHFGTPPEIVAETARYLRPLVWSTFPLMLYMALRRYLQSTNRVALVTVSLVTANLVNLLFDWMFLYGHLGFHPMGVAGSARATVLVRWYMLALLIVGFVHSLRKDRLRLTLDLFRPELSRLRLLSLIGWPSAVEYVTDLGFSTWMSIVCARLGTTLLAAHQVVLDLDAFVYMVPLGLYYATSIRVGQNAGQGNVLGVRRSARASLILGLGFIAVAASLFAGLPHLWASIYTNDPAVIEAAAPIFLVCAFAQFGDAADVLFQGALVGLGDTRTPFYVNTFVTWIVGAPISWMLAFHSPLALTGLWIGRSAATITCATILGFAWRARVRRAENREEHAAPPFTLLQNLKPAH